MWREGGRRRRCVVGRWGGAELGLDLVLGFSMYVGWFRRSSSVWVGSEPNFNYLNLSPF